MKDIYYPSRIEDIPNNELAAGISELITTTVLDYGRAVDPGLQRHIIGATYNTLKQGKFKSWRWEEVVGAFKLGKIGKYQGESRMCVVSVERWLHGYNEMRMKAGQDQNIKQKREMEQKTYNIALSAPYAAAVSRRYKQATSAPGAKETVFAIPLKQVIAEMSGKEIV